MRSHTIFEPVGSFHRRIVTVNHVQFWTIVTNVRLMMYDGMSRRNAFNAARTLIRIGGQAEVVRETAPVPVR